MPFPPFYLFLAGIFDLDFSFVPRALLLLSTVRNSLLIPSDYNFVTDAVLVTNPSANSLEVSLQLYGILGGLPTVPQSPRRRWGSGI
jgi:hypothetical protein